MHGVETSRRMSLNVRVLDQTGAKTDPEDVHKISARNGLHETGCPERPNGHRDGLEVIL
jgi:hypothetical protein